MKKILNRNKYVFLVALCLFIGFLPVIVFNNSSLVFNGDDFHQIYQFYLGAINKIQTNNFQFYDFSIGFGANVFAMAYYLFSPFFLFTNFLNKNLVHQSFLYFNIIKIILLFIFTTKWAKEVFKHNTSVLIGGFIISFSGWVFSYLHLYVFLDAFILYPLVLYFIEKYLKENKIICFVLTLSLIGMINYYFMYMFIPFICLYALIRTIELEYNTVNKIIQKGFKFVCLIFISIGISSFILIPCAYMLSSNPRFSSDITLFSRIGKYDLFKILSGFFAPTVDHESTSIFIDLEKYNFIGWGGGASLYMMAISGVLLPLIFKLKNKIRKRSLIAVFILFFIMIIFKSFWYLLQLNMESRWFYMICFMIAYGVMSINDEIEDGLIDNKYVFYSFFVYVGIAWIFYGISYVYTLTSDISRLFNILCFVSFIGILTLIYYVKKVKKLLVIILSLEAIFSVNMLVLNDKPVDFKITEEVLKDDKIVEYLKRDKSFHRIIYNDEYLGDFRYTTSNTPYENDFKGVSFYSTIYNSEMEDFLKRIKNNWQMDQRYSSWDLYNLLSVKYIYGKSDIKQVPFGYSFKEYYDDYYIYENKNFIELGFTYDKTISKDEFDKLTYLNQDLIMSEYLIVDEKSNNTVGNINIIDYGKMGFEDIRYYAFENPLNNVNLYIENGNIENTQVDMFYKEKLLYSGNFWQYNYLDFYIDKNTYVDLIIVSGNNENQKYDISLKVKPMDYYEKWFSERFKEKFYDVKYKNDVIEAKIDIDSDNKWVFTSIGYDKGWKVYVDGEKVETNKVQLGFLGFKLNKGSHSVKMVYEVPYLKVGLIVSSISFIILIYLNFKLRGKNVNNIN